MPLPPFSDSDLAAIRAAVEEAERSTSGEIVPYVVAASDGYLEAAWKGAAFGAFLAALGAWGIYRWGGFWGGQLFLWMVVPPAAGGAVGFLAVHSLAPLRRALAGHEVMAHRVEQRAAAAFLEQEVWKTRRRTGILLFLSLFERRVKVLGDSGIHQQVEEGEWDEVVRQVVHGIRAGNPGAALVAAIGECGSLLARPGLTP